MKRTTVRTTAVLGFVLAAALTACGSDDSRPQDERDYLSHVYDAAKKEGSGIKGYGDDKVVKLGRDVCKKLDGGAAPGDVVAAIKRDDGSDFHAVSDVATEIVGSAQTYLCNPKS
ncbi:DUF732 domain-containing protein [Streptomyces cacaoi]|uniref:DUF732 domain-containing protein n=1 Tax=Streptomyces cacaoi TaxID=1898 RepID=UPI003748EABF